MSLRPTASAKFPARHPGIFQMVSTVLAFMGGPGQTSVVFGAATHHYVRSARGITLPVSAGTKSASRLRALGVALTLVLGLIFALVLEAGHPAEAADLLACSTCAVAVQQGDDGGTDTKAPWHAVHCGAHCAGHAVSQPARLSITCAHPTLETWSVLPTRHPVSQGLAVQHRPPRA